MKFFNNDDYHVIESVKQPDQYLAHTQVFCVSHQKFTFNIGSSKFLVSTPHNYRGKGCLIIKEVKYELINRAGMHPVLTSKTGLRNISSFRHEFP